MQAVAASGCAAHRIFSAYHLAPRPIEGCNYKPCQPSQGGFVTIFMPYMDSAKRCSCKPIKSLEVLGW